MNSFTLLLVCVQALLIQNVLGYPYAAPGPYPCGAPIPTLHPCCGAPAPYIAQTCEPFGISAKTNNLAIDGTAKVWGDMPFASSVSLDGKVPSEGIASLRDACCCGGYLH